MDDSLNPYASPQFAVDAPVLDEGRTLTATFVIDSLWQRRVVGRLTPRQHERVIFMVALIFAITSLITIVAVCSSTNHLDVNRLVIVLFLGVWFGALLGLLAIFPLMIGRFLLNWFCRAPQYPRGLCTLRIEADQMRFISSDGELVRPLEKATFDAKSRRIWIFISPSDQVLMIDHTADFGDDDFQSWCDALRGRRKIAMPKLNRNATK